MRAKAAPPVADSAARLTRNAISRRRLEEFESIIQVLATSPHRNMLGREIAERMYASLRPISGLPLMGMRGIDVELKAAERYQAIIQRQPDPADRELLRLAEPEAWHYVRLWARRADVVCQVAAEHYAHFASGWKVAEAMH